METNINYTLVGAFVIALVASFVFGIIWLSSGFSIEHYSTYMVYMQESVTGLSVDSAVEYNGVDVGQIKNISLNHHDPRLVELLLNIKMGTPITEGTVATLTTKGVTGLAYLALKDKGANLAPLKTLPGQSYPVIKTAPSLFMRLDTTLSDLSANIKQVSQSVQTLLDKDNQQAIKNILVNMQQITSVLADNNKKFTSILQNTAKASQQFGPMISSASNAAHMFETQTLPLTYRLLSNLDNVTRTLSEVSVEIKQNPSVLIRGIDRQASGPGESK